MKTHIMRSLFAILIAFTLQSTEGLSGTPTKQINRPTGTGGGNEYFHFVNSSFEFHVAAPKTWACENCTMNFDMRSMNHKMAQRMAPSQDTVQWRILAPEQTSWISIDFITGFPAEHDTDQDPQLKRAIEDLHPNIDWQRIGRSGFLGYTSSVLGGHANEAIEYYLVKSRMVIKIQWQKDGRLPERAYEIDMIRRSIDRTTQPTRIQSITTQKTTPYKVGDTVCYFIAVDDLRSAFSKASLTTFEIEGTPSYWNFKTIDWDAEQGQFKVCYKVLSSFGPSGLRIKKLSITDETDRFATCAEEEKGSDVLVCGGLNSSMTYLTPRVAAIDNHMVDQSGPDIHEVHFEEQDSKLKIIASDVTGLGLGEVKINGETIIFYPDQLAQQKQVSIAHATHLGWNTIDSVQLIDSNGLPTLLRIPEADNAEFKKLAELKNFKEAKAGKPHLENATYERITWNGTIEATSIPIIYFLVSRSSL